MYTLCTHTPMHITSKRKQRNYFCKFFLLVYTESMNYNKKDFSANRVFSTLSAPQMCESISVDISVEILSAVYMNCLSEYNIFIFLK